MTYAIFQAVVVALILAWSLWFAMRRFFPRAWRGALAYLAVRLSRSSHVRVRALGTRLMPHQVAGGGGCDSGGACSSCGACAPASGVPTDARPLVFHPRAKS